MGKEDLFQQQGIGDYLSHEFMIHLWGTEANQLKLLYFSPGLRWLDHLF